MNLTVPKVTLRGYLLSGSALTNSKHSHKEGVRAILEIKSKFTNFIVKCQVLSP